MKALRFIILWIKSFWKPQFNVRPEHKIVKAFVIGGKQFYKWEKALEIPYERSLWAHTYYQCFQSGVDRDYLTKHVEAMNKIVNSKTIKFMEIARLTMFLEERMKMTFPPDLAWKLASVEYFTKDEDPYKFDQLQAHNNILFWKANCKDMESFFLSMPIGDLISYIKQSGIDMKSYLSVMEKVQTYHLDFLSTILSNDSLTTKR